MGRARQVLGVLVASICGAAATGAAEARRPSLSLTGAPVERVDMCGQLRTAVVVSVGRPVVARVASVRGARPRLVRERCRNGRWVGSTRLRLVRSGRTYRARPGTTRPGDYRLRAQAGRARSRTSYLRVRGRGPLVRKDVRDLTAAQRREFVDAVLRLKSVPSPYQPGLSYYDQFVAWHQVLSRCDPRDPLLTDIQRSHLGPMFLPWHRLFVVVFERALREVSGKDIPVPYWDWTEASSTRAVFAEDFMGGEGEPGQGYAVTTGPFRKGRWDLNVHPVGQQWASSATPHITRRFGSFPTIPLPDAADVRAVLEAPLYDVAPYTQESDSRRSFRNALEGWLPPLSGAIGCGPDGVVAEGGRPPQELHNAVHIWVGGVIAPDAGPGRLIGTMFNVTSSPNDPVFFLHHSMVDRIWAEWQARHGVDTYMPRSGHPKNNIDDVMVPFDEAGIRFAPRDVADIQRLGYRYDSTASRRLRTRPWAPEPPIRWSCGLAR